MSAGERLPFLTFPDEAGQWPRREAFEQAGLLLYNDAHNPRRAVAAQGWDKDRLKLINDLAVVWDTAPNWARTDDLMDAVYSAYGLVVSEPGPVESLLTLRRMAREIEALVAKIVAKR